MIIWISSVPRSGNTFFRILLHHCSCDHIPTYSETNDQLFFDIHVSDIVGHKKMPDMSLLEMSASGELYFIKTHKMLPMMPQFGKSVYIVRDPHDVIASYAHHLLWRVGYESFDAAFRYVLNTCMWHVHVEESLDRADTFIRYEDMIDDPYGSLEKAIAELDVPLCIREQNVPDFGELHRMAPNFFRKGVVGATNWYYTKELEAQLYDRLNPVMQRLSYKWIYQ